MVAAIGAVAGVAGSAISASAAGDAADAQSAASQQSSMIQMAQMMQRRQDLEPWTRAGAAASGLLGRYLGLGVGSSGLTSSGLQTGLTPSQVREQLLGRFTRQVQPDGGAASAARWANDNNYQSLIRMGMSPEQAARMRESELASDAERFGVPGGNLIGWGQSPGGMDASRSPVYGIGAPGIGYVDQVDEEGLNAAIQEYYAEQERLNREAAQDPTYGSLLRPYRNGEEFSFTGKDLANEPGYQFGLQQGTQGIERGQAARGNFLSGAAMKELTRFNEDYAGTKFNDAFGRSLNTWNTNRNAYDTNRDRIFNFLTGTSTLGQNSAAQVGAGNQQAANQISGNLLASGNAQSAAAIAGGNAWQSGLNQVANNLRSGSSVNSPGG